MKKKILFPTDFSDNAWSTIVYGLKLYSAFECKFYFLHTTKNKVSTMSNFSNKLSSLMQDNAMKELKDLEIMTKSANANANHEFEIILSSKELRDAIEASVKKHEIDLVMMGTKGATGAKEFLFGSNTVSVIKKMKLCPILIVPDAFDFVEPKQIAFPTDFNRFYGEELLPLKRLADKFNPEIRIVHINKEDNLTPLQSYNYEMIKSYLNNYSCSFHWMPDYAKKTQEINDFINEFKI
jgi:nucleotide-binding universal stress UspA family protein